MTPPRLVRMSQQKQDGPSAPQALGSLSLVKFMMGAPFGLQLVILLQRPLRPHRYQRRFQ